MYVDFYTHVCRFVLVMLLGGIFAAFVPEVQYKKSRKNIPLEKLALGRQPEEVEGIRVGTTTSGTL